MRHDRRPVSRQRVLVGALILFGFLAGMVLVVESMRHPRPEGAAQDLDLAEDDSDPRLTTECDQELPREGQQRSEDEGAADGGGAGEAESSSTVVDVTPVVVTSSQLYDCPQTYDGATVRYSGEVVGAVLHRDGGAWVHLNDDIYANVRGPLPAHRDYRGGNAGIGVYISSELADQIEWIGGPDQQGDEIVVTGTFERVDPITAEVAIIRADEGRIDRRGAAFNEPRLPERRWLAMAVAVIAAIVTLAERLVARRR